MDLKLYREYVLIGKTSSDSIYDTDHVRGYKESFKSL